MFELFLARQCLRSMQNPNSKNTKTSTPWSDSDHSAKKWWDQHIKAPTITPASFALFPVNKVTLFPLLEEGQVIFLCLYRHESWENSS